MKSHQIIRKTVTAISRVLAVVAISLVAWSVCGHGDIRSLIMAVPPVAAIQARNKRLVALDKKKSDLTAKMQKILDEADGEDLTEEQEEQYSALEEELETATKAYNREYRLEESRASRPDFNAANNDPEGEEDLRQHVKTKPAWEDDPKAGFASHQEFLMAVMEAPVKGEVSDDRLKFLATAGSDEQGGHSDPHGGFFMPEGLYGGVMSLGFDGDPTNPMMIPMQTQVVNINARVDKNHSSSVSGGLTVGRTAETQEPSSSRQSYEQIKLEARMQTGLAYATEQLLQRSPISFAALLDQGFRDEFASQTLKEKIYGTGAGEPQGVINAPGTVSVAKEGGQSADTIVTANILNMRKRAWRYGRSIWLANHDTLDTLMQLHIAGTNGDRFLFAPGNGTDSPDTFLGRPIFFTEWCKTIGDKGDIVLGDWSQYLWGYLGTTTPNRAESVHVRFLNHERTFKFWLENDGSPWWRTPLTPANGANTLSPFVTLDERA